eukprot:CAMPEP_0171111776 /NCGR_PEP_ID=MMETSP0766_2-20121228/76587_1 /TAXON_ID=439317 /ORGANISM="Gambierdiscus australes, Strain CAWD 149" /LENGTH=147 /DNA_ID=CAMNT_0011573815 /DNA_START=307 /DNA_END=750 /DNA_ORIENTATION=-
MALTSAPAHKSRLMHSAEPFCAENIKAVIPTLAGSLSSLMEPPPCAPLGRASGFCGFITRGLLVSVHAPLSRAALTPFTLPWRAYWSSSWLSNTSSLIRAPPRFAVATACLTPSSSAAQPTAASSSQVLPRPPCRLVPPALDRESAP